MRHKMCRHVSFTAPFSLTAQPALSLPLDGTKPPTRCDYRPREDIQIFNDFLHFRSRNQESARLDINMAALKQDFLDPTRSRS